MVVKFGFNFSRGLQSCWMVFCDSVSSVTLLSHVLIVLGLLYTQKILLLFILYYPVNEASEGLFCLQ